MDKLVKKYLLQFKGAQITEVNEYINIAFLLKNNNMRYIQLDGNFRLFLTCQMVFTKSELKEINNLRKYINGAIVKNITIGKFNDLTIKFEQGILLQIIVDSMIYENWVINQDVICLPGGEITHFLKPLNKARNTPK
ncbi:MAG: hypothetical protein KKH01_01525 [Firmicutes bacterium]|nr:hypothetical protein [Bacillota bacterium]